MKKNITRAIGASIVALGLGTSAFGAQLLQFEPDPITPTQPELAWNASQELISTASGLSIDVALVVAGGGGSVSGTHTKFANASLELNSVGATNPASNLVIPITPTESLTVVAQPIGDGTFKIWNADKSAVLLEGHIATAVIQGFQGSSQAPVTSPDKGVHYTGGVIFDALRNALGTPNATSIDGGISWSLTEVSDAGLVKSGDFLSTFTANASGLFTTPTIPEPASISLLALGGLALLRRVRKA